jgi:predicted ferric reductase
MATATPARSGPPFRLTLRGTAILVGLLGLLLVYATDQILPASTDRQAEMRFWLAARATGIVAFLLLTGQIVLGLVLSHPTNRSTWNLSKRIFPWHDHLWVFVLAFLIAHIVSLVVDPKAGVSLAGAFIPGLSEYRSSPVAIGTLALYAFLVTAISARWTKLLPRGVWLSIHRLALVIWVMAWMHGVLAGTDTGALALLYVAAGVLVVGAGAYRYMASRKQKPTFATSRQEDAPG